MIKYNLLLYLIAASASQSSMFGLRTSFISPIILIITSSPYEKDLHFLSTTDQKKGPKRSSLIVRILRLESH